MPAAPTITPVDPHDLEASMRTTPTTEKGKGLDKELMAEDAPPQPPVLQNAAGAVTPAMRRKSWAQFFALCVSIFVAGWDSGTVGPLLPRLQEVGYAVVSLIFIVNCIGFFVGASSFLYLTDRFGFGRVVIIASFFAAVGYAIQAAGVPFPAFVVSFLFSGFGIAFLDAGSNSYLAGLSEDTSFKMGVMHAIFGVGAMCAPLVSTQFAKLDTWHYVYLVHLGLIAFNALTQALVFRFRTAEECLREVGQEPHAKTKASEEGVGKYRQVFRLRAVHLMAFFIFTYVGVEVAIGGWIVTYIINERGGGGSSGYISSGFWGGLTLGRVLLIWVNDKVGEWRVIFLYVALAFGLELVVWLVPHLISAAVCVSFVGFFLGPIFPIVMNHSGRVLPPELISGGIGYISSFGSAGAAAFPFVTGAIASGTNIGSLQPLLIAMMALMFAIWVFVPRTREQLR